MILLMEEILLQLIGTLSHHLQGSLHPRWCRISSINSIIDMVRPHQCSMSTQEEDATTVFCLNHINQPENRYPWPYNPYKWPNINRYLGLIHDPYKWNYFTLLIPQQIVNCWFWLVLW